MALTEDHPRYGIRTRSSDNGTKQLIYWLMGALLSVLLSLTGIMILEVFRSVDSNTLAIRSLESSSAVIKAEVDANKLRDVDFEQRVRAIEHRLDGSR